jgi:hypothetical protein
MTQSRREKLEKESKTQETTLDILSQIKQAVVGGGD